MALIREKPQITTIMAKNTWTIKVMKLLGQFLPKQKTDETNPDYQYLQSVIKGELSNMNDPEIGKRLTDIFTRNTDNTAFKSYVQQAVAAYKQALFSISKQFLGGA